jgi:hypothetical protein
MLSIAIKSTIAAFLVGATLAGSTVVAAAKDCPYTPAPGSTERKAIMDALRDPVMEELKQRVVFVVMQLKVCGDWAFLEANPQQPDGRPVDWTMGVYADAVADDMCGGYVHALLVKTVGRWRVREHVICATDVPWVDWAQQFGAPAALFPRFD